MRRRDGFVVGAGIVTAFLIATDLVPALRGPENWRWARRVLDAPLALLANLAVFGATAVVAQRIRAIWGSAPNTRRGPLLGAATALLFLQMVLLTAVEPGGLSNVPRRVQDPSFTSYQTVARDVENPLEFLRRYHRQQKRFPVHAPSQPPGRVLYFWLVERAVGTERAPAAAGFLLMAIGSLAVVPLTVIVGGRRAPGAVGSAVLVMACLPSFLLFTPQTDHLILALTLTAAAAALEALRSAGRPRALALALGAGLSGGTSLFVSWTTLPALFAWGLVAIGMLLLARSRQERLPSAGALAKITVAFLAGLLVVPAATAAAGMNWPAVFRESVAAAHRFQVLIYGREYSTWVVGNLWDFALFLGPPLTIAWLVRVGPEARALLGFRREEGGAGLEAPFATVLLLVIVVLDVTGKIRGETGRIWMFLMPLAVTAVASVAGTHRLVWTLVGAQLLVLVSLRMFLNVPG